jgi:hypothetical protein
LCKNVLSGKLPLSTSMEVTVAGTGQQYEKMSHSLLIMLES